MGTPPAAGLSREDEKRVQRFIRHCFPAVWDGSRNVGSPSPLHYLLSRWSAFVGDVELGYRFSIFEYINDLCVRDILNVLLAELSDDGRPRVTSVVDPLDARLLAATVPISKPIETPSGVEKQWWCRIPRVLPDELRSDLARDGLL